MKIMPQPPALIFSLLLASIYAALFYLWQGRRWRDLLFYWLAAVVGFAAGQIAGPLLNLIPWTIGQVRVVEGSLIALLFLFIARWLLQEGKLQEARGKGQDTRGKLQVARGKGQDARNRQSGV